MKMKKQLWNLRLEDKGMIFTLDAIIAVLVVSILMIASAHFAGKEESSLPDLQLSRIGYDIVALLDYSKTLDTLDAGIIKNEMNDLLPSNYNMKIKITTNYGVTREIGDAIPDNKFIATGKRAFVIVKEGKITDYGIAQFWVWLK